MTAFNLFLFVCGFVAVVNGAFTVPLSIVDPRVEPFTGLVFWSSTPKEYINSTTLEFLYLLYSDVVTGIYRNGSIIYDWTSFEKNLNSVKKRNHQAIVRMRYTDPAVNFTAVPEYIKNMAGYNETNNGKIFYPDWRFAELKRFHKLFYTDLSARYDNDPRIAFFQSGFGHWAEYHIYDTDIELGVNFPSKDFQAEFWKHIDGLFNETPICFGINSASKEYSPLPDHWELGLLNYGLFDDSFMMSTHDSWQGPGAGYNEGLLIIYNYTERYLRQPIGGEIAVDDQPNFLGPEGVHGTTWEKASSKYHISYMLGSKLKEGPYGTAERVREAGKHAGYHIVVTDFVVDGTEAKVTVTNSGIAPIYHSMFVTVNGIRSETSMKLHAPGETKTYIVKGLESVSSPSDVNLTFTSDKLYPGQEVPYDAHVGEPDSPSSSSLVVPILLYVLALAFVCIDRAW